MFRLLDGLSDEDHSSGSQDLDNSQDTAGSSAVEGPPNDAPTTAAAATAVAGSKLRRWAVANALTVIVEALVVDLGRRNSD